MESVCTPTFLNCTVRHSLLYDDTLLLFPDDDLANEYPFYVEFKDKLAVDCGGVARDMLSGFWEEAAKRTFDGYRLLVPEIDMQVFPIMGRVLSHGFLACNYLSVVIVFPAIVGILLSPKTVVPDSILLQVLPDFLSDLEAGVLREAIACTLQFTNELRNKLVAVLARFDCREISTNKTIKALLIRITRCEFLSKPLAAVTLMNNGIPSAHKAWWQSNDFYRVYVALTATSTLTKVLEMLHVDTANQNEERVLTSAAVYWQDIILLMMIIVLYTVLKLSEAFQEDISTRERSRRTKENSNGATSQSDQSQKTGMKWFFNGTW